MMNTVTVYALKDPKTKKYVATGTDGVFLTSDLSEAELFYIYGFALHANEYLTYGEAKIVTVKITYEEEEGSR